MLKEGRPRRVSIYRVYYEYNGDHEDVYIQALSAQQAVDIIRGDDPDVHVLEVSKVVNNWK
jgi:hypothetical protein